MWGERISDREGIRGEGCEVGVLACLGNSWGQQVREAGRRGKERAGWVGSCGAL